MPKTEIHWCRLERIINGNTLEVVDVNGEKTTVRLWGIDAPEKGQPHGLFAMVAMYRTVKGKPLTVKIKSADDFGRPIARVVTAELDVSRVLVRSGHAWRNPNFGESSVLKGLERYARDRELGLWAELSGPGPDPIPPWEWRDGRGKPEWSEDGIKPPHRLFRELADALQGPLLWIAVSLLMLTLLVLLALWGP